MSKTTRVYFGVLQSELGWVVTVELPADFLSLGRGSVTPHIRRVLHPSAPSAPSASSAPLAPSAPFEIARNPIAQQAVYSRRCPKRNIKTPSYGTH